MEEKIEISDILVRFEKYDMALEVLESLQEEYKDNQDIILRIAKIYEKQGIIDTSIEKLREAIDLSPDKGELYFKLATLFQKREDYDKCFQYLNLAIKLGYESEKVFFYKGLVFESLNKFEDALRLYNKSLMKNKFYMAPKYRKYALFINRNMINDGKKVLEDMIENNSDEYDGFSLMYSLEMNIQNYDKAQKVLNKAKMIFNEYPPLTLDFIKYFISQGEYEKAEEIIQGINEDSEYYVDFIIEKSRILAIKGEYQEAISLLSSDDIYEEDNITLLYLLSIFNYFVGNYKSALKYLNNLENSDDLKNEYVKYGMLIKGLCLKEIGTDEAVKGYFNKLYRIYKIQSLSNPYDINTLILRIMTLIEIQDFEKATDLIHGIEKLDYEKYKKQVDSLKEIINERKKGAYEISLKDIIKL
ncbi:hypothetical protein [Clostridium tertium]|uniref:Tetratricopeptide repeat protein n=1 Tax=Clostridium tertium TaxID=1559 RepID=A0A6N3A3E7_9CLOT